MLGGKVRSNGVLTSVDLDLFAQNMYFYEKRKTDQQRVVIMQNEQVAGIPETSC